MDDSRNPPPGLAAGLPPSLGGEKCCTLAAELVLVISTRLWGRCRASDRGGLGLTSTKGDPLRSAGDFTSLSRLFHDRTEFGGGGVVAVDLDVVPPAPQPQIQVAGRAGHGCREVAVRDEACA